MYIQPASQPGQPGSQLVESGCLLDRWDGMGDHMFEMI